MLSGPFDYTPGIFNLEPNGKGHENRVRSTLAKELSLYVVLYSPIHMAADLIEHYEARRDAFQFIVDVPTDWEQSRALAGEVGEFVAMARQQRGARDWFLGALTNERARSGAQARLPRPPAALPGADLPRRPRRRLGAGPVRPGDRAAHGGRERHPATAPGPRRRRRNPLQSPRMRPMQAEKRRFGGQKC
jgi:hypothetical protein